MGPDPHEPTIGVVTINDDENFGNRLQAFALQRALAALGARSELVRNTPPPMSRALLTRRAAYAAVSDGPLAVIARNRGGLAAHRGVPPARPGRYAARRRTAIAAFTAQHIAVSPTEFDQRRARDWARRYDRVIVGSDQVWNPGFRNAHDIDFLTFAAEEDRIAYAASFGVPRIPAFLRSRYRRRLAAIPHLSVREHRAAQIVAELTGREVPVVLDPTLLLAPEDWSPLRERGRRPASDRYAVRFFLGTPDPAQTAWVQALATERGVHLLELDDLDTPEFADLGPDDFVAALSDAEFVATDSFHASVFSLLHRTPLVVRARDDTDSRVHTLLETLGIERTPTGLAGLWSALDPDWSRAEDLLAAEREASLTYLRDAIGARTRAEV